MIINIITVGKKHEPELAPLIEDFEKKISHTTARTVKLEWKFIPHGKTSDPVNEESKAIRDYANSICTPSDPIILLDERGKEFDSLEFSKLIDRYQIDSSKRLVFIIGGAYGVNDLVRERTSLTVSLSNMTFPHQIVRLILAEQIYRAFSIIKGGSYHHG